MSDTAPGGYYKIDSSVYTVNSSGVITSIGACCDPYGTLISTFCAGYTYKGYYADGSCGSYVGIIEDQSGSCGFSGCTTYQYTTYGYDSYYDCTGTYQTTGYLLPGDSVCADNNNPPGFNWVSTYSACNP